MRSPCHEETSSQSTGSLVNPENENGRKRVGQAPGNWLPHDSKLEVGNSQVSRQEKVPQAPRKLGQKGQTQTNSEENPSSTRKLVASSPEFRNVEFTKHQYIGKIFEIFKKE